MKPIVYLLLVALVCVPIVSAIDPLPTLTYSTRYVDPLKDANWSLDALGQVSLDVFGDRLGQYGDMIVISIWLFSILAIIALRTESIAVPFVLLVILANVGLFVEGFIPDEWRWAMLAMFVVLPVGGLLYYIWRGSR